MEMMSAFELSEGTRHCGTQVSGLGVLVTFTCIRNHRRIASGQTLNIIDSIVVMLGFELLVAIHLEMSNKVEI